MGRFVNNAEVYISSNGGSLKVGDRVCEDTQRNIYDLIDKNGHGTHVVKRIDKIYSHPHESYGKVFMEYRVICRLLPLTQEEE